MTKTKENMESKSVMKRIAIQTKDIQEKVFNWLWPDKCWHDAILVYEKRHGIVDTYGCTKDGCKYDYLNADNGVAPKELLDNPDLTDPANTFMILNRLVEMGYRYTIQGNMAAVICRLFKEGVCEVSSDVITEDKEKGYKLVDHPPLAVLNATLRLIEKE